MFIFLLFRSTEKMRVSLLTLEILHQEYRNVFEYFGTSEVQSFPQLFNNQNYIKRCYAIYTNCQGKLVRFLNLYNSLISRPFK